MHKYVVCLLVLVLVSFSACTEVPVQPVSNPSISNNNDDTLSPKNLPVIQSPTPIPTPSSSSASAPTPTPELSLSPTPAPTPSFVPDLVVTITKPLSKSTSELEKIVFLSAELTNPSNVPVSFIEFRADEMVLGLVAKSAFSSFSYNWTPNNIKTGKYSIVAVALDTNKTELGKSEAVEITLIPSSRSGGGGGGGSSFVPLPAPAATPTPAPTVTNFNPSSGFPGVAIALTGTDFTGATAVTFNGVAAASFTVTGSTTITAIAPTGATDGVISVTTPAGSASSATNFTFVAPPTGVHFVKANATGTNDGSNWINAYTTLQSALGAATSGQEIWVAAGTYKPTTVVNRSATFTIGSDYSIYGGFAGTESLRTARNISTNSSILSGDTNGDDTGFTNNTENVYHVVINTAANARIDGVIIQGGNADGTGADGVGGGLWAQANTILANTRFQYNHGVTAGGAVYSQTETITVEGGTFDNNRGTLGGALYNQGGTLAISNTAVFSNNIGITAGGAIYTQTSSTLTVANTTFNMNTSTGSEGGAVYHNGGTMTVTDSTFTNNNTTAGTEGGAVFQTGSDTATYTRVIFQNNSAGNFGGAICAANGTTVNVHQSVFDTNTGVQGGAIFGDNMTGTINNSVFYNNSATSQGGAIGQPRGTTNVFNSTFASNSATTSGGAILSGSAGNASTLNLTNSILWSNTAPTGPQMTLLNVGSATTIGFSNLQGNLAAVSNANAATLTDGTNNIATDPLFVNMADPNGTDDTYRTADDGLQIQAGSGALDTGTATGAPVIDIVGTGTARPQGGGHDIGAYERP